MTDPKTIQIADLRPGDVLLSRGEGTLSDMICQLDNGIYSHAAYWTGDNVIEAGLKGVVANTIEGELGQIYVDAYRLHKDGHELGQPGWPVAPINALAEEFVGAKYAYADLLLLGLLLSQGPKIDNPLAKTLVRLFGGLAAQKLQDLLDEWRKVGKQPLVCTQVVTKSYYEASEQQYAIEVVLAELRRNEAANAAPLAAMAEASCDDTPAIAEEQQQLVALQESCRRLLQPHAIAAQSLQSPRMLAAAAAAPTVLAGSPLLPIVTPRELQESPSLRLVGRIAK